MLWRRKRIILASSWTNRSAHLFLRQNSNIACDVAVEADAWELTFDLLTDAWVSTVDLLAAAMTAAAPETSPRWPTREEGTSST